MHATPEQIADQARHDEHLRQLRAEFDKLWQAKLAPLLAGFHESMADTWRYRDLCWLAFKEGK